MPNHSLAARLRMSAQRKGLAKSPEHRAKLAAHCKAVASARTGAKWTAEQKAALKIARAHINHKDVSAETRAAHSASAKHLWAEGRLGVPPANRNTTLAQALHAHLSATGLSLEPEVRFGRFTVDLYDRAHHIAYEADGMYWHNRHEAKHPGYSAQRDAYLIQFFGLKVVHFSDKEISALTGWPRRRKAVA